MLAYTSRYFNVIALVMRRLIKKRYGCELAKRACDGARTHYRALLGSAPPICADNPMAKNLYEACVFFAPYRAACVTIHGPTTCAGRRWSKRPILRGVAVTLRKDGRLGRPGGRFMPDSAWCRRHVTQKRAFGLLATLKVAGVFLPNSLADP